ncbi:hypothetical protein D3C75_845580 [compost metagenome]
MQALIPIRLGMGYIIFDLQYANVFACAEVINQTVNIFNKSTYNPHTCNIVNVLLHIFQVELETFALHLLKDTLGFFNSAFNMFDGTEAVTDLPFRFDHIDFILKII